MHLKLSKKMHKIYPNRAVLLHSPSFVPAASLKPLLAVAQQNRAVLKEVSLLYPQQTHLFQCSGSHGLEINVVAPLLYPSLSLLT